MRNRRRRRSSPIYTFLLVWLAFSLIGGTDWFTQWAGLLITAGVGIIAGVARQSIMAFAVGIAAGLGLYYAPTVIDKTLSAVPLESDPQLLYRALSQLCM